MAKKQIGWENIDEISKMIKNIPEISREKEMQKIFAKSLRQNVLKKIKSQLPAEFQPFVKIKKNSGFDSKEDIAADTAVGIHKDGYKLRWLVYGTKKRTTETGKNTGSIQAEKVQRIDKTILSSKDTVINSVYNDFVKNLQKVVKKYKK